LGDAGFDAVGINAQGAQLSLARFHVRSLCLGSATLVVLLLG
jgi:hypothetical protein